MKDGPEHSGGLQEAKIGALLVSSRPLSRFLDERETPSKAESLCLSEVRFPSEARFFYAKCSAAPELSESGRWKRTCGHGVGWIPAARMWWQAQSEKLGRWSLVHLGSVNREPWKMS